MTVTDTMLAELLRSWLPEQRWFAGKGGGIGTISLLSRAELPAGPGGTRVEHLLLEVSTTAGVHRYQVLLGWRADLPPELAAAALATVEGVTAYDALLDVEILGDLLRGIAGDKDCGPLRLRAEPGAHIDCTAVGRVIGGEQSNTSVIYGDSAILKVFRRIESGTNPDLEVHRGLAAVGSPHTAAPLGRIEAEIDGDRTTLGLLSEFFAGATDGWDLATDSVAALVAGDREHGDFTDESRLLGAAIARVHSDLRAAFGEEGATVDRARGVLGLIATEAHRVAGRVPSLAPHAGAIDAVFDRLAQDPVPQPIQRIHGDLHLGQTLRTPRGWAVIDFEGEPSKPLAVRRAHQLLVRDIAGMLRSFDYAAGHCLMTGGGLDRDRIAMVEEWTRVNRAAFLDGYRSAATDPLPFTDDLLRAFELDKAVYEVAYEHDNRPTWEAIPLHAVTTLTTAGGHP